ncbi:NfeD family protein [Sphingomonas sp. Mn802worker]|uniref:NfeD family protein n=1 Tax=Sphingomonas sp. Mn802worker TaxID=629773 RepID=UPI00037C9422|nr:NfeD family protein [Sphingomonas sp. Mn802worker]
MNPFIIWGDFLSGIGGAGGWLIAALLLGIAELAIPGVFLVFVAVAAAIVGLALLALPDLPIAAQIGAFAAWSVVTVLIGRRWYRDYPVEGDAARLNDPAARLVGAVVTVERAIEHGSGRVTLGDGAWPARGPELPTGVSARVVAVDAGVLVVEPLDG